MCSAPDPVIPPEKPPRALARAPYRQIIRDAVRRQTVTGAGAGRSTVVNPSGDVGRAARVSLGGGNVVLGG